MCTVFLPLLYSNTAVLLMSLYAPLLPGDGPGREEGDPPAVQAEGQVLPRGRDRGADPGRHPQALLPAGEGGHSGGGDLLPSRVRCAAGLLRHPGQVRGAGEVCSEARLPGLRAPAAQEVSESESVSSV